MKQPVDGFVGCERTLRRSTKGTEFGNDRHSSFSVGICLFILLLHSKD